MEITPQLLPRRMCFLPRKEKKLILLVEVLLGSWILTKLAIASSVFRKIKISELLT
jgi:hypothetical protein